MTNKNLSNHPSKLLLVSLSVMTAVLIVLSSSFMAQAEQLNAKALYIDKCAACHGENAQGNPSLNAPVLAGQYAWYLNQQMNNFSEGLRGANDKDISGKGMSLIAKQLTDQQEVNQLTHFLAEMKIAAKKNGPSVKKDIEQSVLKNGSRYYQAKCGACHGGKAQGNESFNAPKLAGQDKNYLKLQMKNFVEGIRGRNKKDKLGRQMAMMAKMAKGKELDDILSFISIQ